MTRAEHRRAAGLDRSLEHGRLEAVDDGEDELHRRMRSPRTSPGRAAARRARARRGSRARGWPAAGRGWRRTPPAAPRPRRRSAAPRGRRGRGACARGRTGCAPPRCRAPHRRGPNEQPVPPGVVAVVDRGGHEQRAEAHRHPRQGGAERAGLQALAADPPLVGDRGRAEERDDDQEGRRLEEGERGALEVDPRVVGGHPARQERGQEGADAGRSREARALQDVEDEVHRALR